MKKIKIPILPKGFKAAGIHCGLKRHKKDLGLIFSDYSCAGAGMFTSNKVQAETLKVCRSQLNNSKEFKAIIVNSGNANCFVGKKGIIDAQKIIAALAKNLDVTKKSILIASTGIIGKDLPLGRITNSIPKLVKSLNRHGLNNFAESIMTTDTFKKVSSVQLNIKNKPVLITGIAKGAGMINPKLEKDKKHATMLVFILTDININRTLLSQALESAVRDSFNRISVDGCMSTNDTVLLLANGAANNKCVSKKNKDFFEFCCGLSYVCKALSLKVVEDGEGATKRIDILIEGAKNVKEAELAANAVANSNLFKTAIFGANPNWGRIISAIGAAGISVEQGRLEIFYNSKKILDRGKVSSLDFRKDLKSKIISVSVDLNRGKFSHLVHTCDLSPEYVKINAQYLRR